MTRAVQMLYKIYTEIIDVIKNCERYGRNQKMGLSESKGHTAMEKIMAGILAATSLALASPSLADPISDGEAICYEIEPQINTLVDYTQTKCFPSKDKKGVTFTLLSFKPVFSVEASKKAWLLVVAAAVGHTLNQRPTMRADSIIVTDVNSIKQLVGWRFPATTAKQLQRDIADGSISLESAYAELNKTIKPFKLPPRTAQGTAR